jgi:hypothetical protein
MESAAQRSGNVNAEEGLSIGYAQEMMALSTSETSQSASPLSHRMTHPESGPENGKTIAKRGVWSALNSGVSDGG